MADWEFGKGKKICSSCTKPVAEGEYLFSALLLDETKKSAEQFLRNDYCGACWESKSQGVFSFWRTQVTKKIQPKTPREILVEFFENLIAPVQDKPVEVDEALRPKIIYLFSLVLLRRKILKIKENIVKPASLAGGDNQPYLVFERIPDGKIYEVPEMAITDEELTGLKDQFAKLFDFEI
ncbi:MAG: hypothetical protein HY811_11665 [Planctomycetes bacterium]|nr:hypothetical protein [Planctomycetota bacterium]